MAEASPLTDEELLVAGALTAGMYFTANSAAETELRDLVDVLYQRIDWRWAQGGAATLRQGWKPECGFLHYGWEGYSDPPLVGVAIVHREHEEIP